MIDPKKIISINHSLIKSFKTREYLSLHNIINSKDLQEIVPLCYTKDQEKDFYLHQKSYLLDFSIEKVWNAYKNIPPNKAWSGRKIQFSFTFDNELGSISYETDKYVGLREGQLIFLEIKLLFGLVKLAVTHQVNKISEESKRMKFCYVEGGKAKGSQLISLKRLSENRTEVIHDTYYKSDSKFRDEKLYPIIHEKIINEFHGNVLNYLTEV